MSYSTIYAVFPGEKVEVITELRNGHGAAPVVWGAICEQYFGNSSAWLFDGEKLWPLWKDDRLAPAHRAALLMTYDRAYIAKADYARAAADIRAFLADYPIPPNRVNHWPAIAELLELDPEYPAMGFDHTSCSDSQWIGPYNEETGDDDSIDWGRTWSVYDELRDHEAKKSGGMA